MSEHIVQIVPLKETAEAYGVPELMQFRSSMKRLGCLIRVSGLEFVDQAKLDQVVAEKAQDAVKAAAKRSSSRRTPAQKVGLYLARVKMYPKWIADKQSSIFDAKQNLETASNNYEKVSANGKLTRLNADLERMKSNQKKDQEQLNAILNADYGSETLPSIDASQVGEE